MASETSKHMTGVENDLPNRRQPVFRVRRVLWTVIAVVGSTLVTYYACEVVYRYSVYRRIVNNSNFQPDVLTELPIDQFDETTGFVYRPGTTTRFVRFNEEGKPFPINDVIRINNMGHFSHDDDALEKSAAEFRIALLGDSMTAAVEMHRPWPDILQESLNHDEDLKKSIGKSTINVINAARSGIGVIQCAVIHQQWVNQFDPDLVILNFIDEDIPRRFVFRRLLNRDLGDFSYDIVIHTYSLPCSAKNPERFFGTLSMDFSHFEDSEKRRRLSQDIARLRVQRVRWFSPYPELLASGAGSVFGFPPRLFSSYAYSHMLNEDEAIQRCAQACRQIKDTSKESLFLCMPDSSDAESQTTQPGRLPYLAQRLAQRAPELDIIPMIRYLPSDATDDQRKRWYVPGDGHLSDEGGMVYAEAMAQKIKEFLSGK